MKSVVVAVLFTDRAGDCGDVCPGSGNHTVRIGVVGRRVDDRRLLWRKVGFDVVDGVAAFGMKLQARYGGPIFSIDGSDRTENANEIISRIEIIGCQLCL